MQSKRRRKRKSPKESKPPPKFSLSKQRRRRCFCGSPTLPRPLRSQRTRHRLRLPKHRLPASGPHSGETAGAVASAFLGVAIGRKQVEVGSASNSIGIALNAPQAGKSRTAFHPSNHGLRGSHLLGNLCVGHFHSQSSLDQGAGNLKFGCLSRKGGSDIRIGQPLLTQFLELQLALLWRCKRSRQGPHRVAGHGIPRRGGFPEAGGCRVVQVGRCSPEGLAPRQIP